MTARTDIAALIHDNTSGDILPANVRNAFNLSLPVGVNLVTDFGAVGDGSTDNAAALNAFSTWAQAESTAGRAVTVTIPPGIYNFNQASCPTFLSNIKRLHMVGYGAIFQNTQSGGAPWPNASNPTMAVSFFINTANAGSTTLTLVNSGDAVNIIPGRWILVASLDIMFSGYPPNPDRFEFVKVVSVSGTTVTIDRTLRYNHRADFPENTGSGGPTNGKARIFALDVVYGSSPPAYNEFDIDHVYEGIEVRRALSSGITYISVLGRSVQFINCILPGISPTVSKLFRMVGGRCTDQSEPDKIIDIMSLDGVAVEGDFAFQSSSINNVMLSNCMFEKNYSHGSAKYVTAQNCTFINFGEGPSFGSNRSATYINCVMHRWDSTASPENNAHPIDGTNVAYASGVFTILKSYSDIGYYLPAPGEWVNLHAFSGNYFTSRPGNGLVTRVYDDSTHIYIETTLPYASLPSWSNNIVQFQMLGNLSFINCGGCDAARLASAATRAGKQPWELFKYTFAGKQSAQTGLFYRQMYGTLRRVRVNVIQTTPISSARFQLNMGTAYSSVDMSNLGDFLLFFDLNVAGIREYTSLALNGKTTNDTITLNSVDQTVLPAINAIGAGVEWHTSYNSASQALTDLPIFDLELEYDSGLFRTGITAIQDIGPSGPSSNITIAGVTGGLS